MFEIAVTRFGEPYLKWVEPPKEPSERPRRPRGRWVEICRVDDDFAQYYVEKNKELGLDVLPDENGFYRALVLKD